MTHVFFFETNPETGELGLCYSSLLYYICYTRRRLTIYPHNTLPMRFTLLPLLILFVISLNGQSENKGKFYLSGNTSLTTNNNLVNGTGQISFSSSQLGYFFGDKWLVGAEVVAGSDEDLLDNSPFTISPFARYYFLQKANTQFFGEAGFGTIGNFGFGSSFETDMHLGVGAERSFGDGIVGTVLLRYKAYASGLNYTELDLGLNVILGGKQAIENFAGRRKGALLVDPTFGGIGFGLQKWNDAESLQIDLQLGIGYFLMEHLLVEAGGSITTENASYGGFASRDISSTEWNAYVGLRYFLPSATGRLQPYAIVRASRERFSQEQGVIINFEPQKTTEFGTTGEAGLGTLYYLTSKAALDFNLRYQKRLDLPADTGHGIGGTLGMKVFFGN